VAALLTPGSMVAQRWIVGGLLGQSERAQVYEAEEARLSRFAALKILAPALGEGEAWNDYVTITKKLAELPGDGIARAYDIGKDSMIERPYVTSERLVFPTLARYVGERGALPLRSLGQSLETLAAALDTAHAAGIVHGGLKPQNVFVSLDNPRWARITDFSLGRLRAETGSGPGSLLGWSAPEVGTGAPSAAGDRYSLALLCFFAATGMPWYSALRSAEGGERGPGSRRASERARGFGGELDPAFDAWFERALAVEPAARFPSAAEMTRAFQQLLSGTLPPPSAVHPFAATRPVPLAEQPTVPVKQVDALGASSPAPTLLAAPAPAGSRSSAPSLTPSSSPPRTAFERTVPLSSIESSPPGPLEPATPTSDPSIQGSPLLKLLAALAAGSVAFAIWWWLR
jgi:serine/threonine protein kinase